MTESSYSLSIALSALIGNTQAQSVMKYPRCISKVCKKYVSFFSDNLYNPDIYLVNETGIPYQLYPNQSNRF